MEIENENNQYISSNDNESENLNFEKNETNYYEKQMKVVSTDILQFLLNEENNNFNDRNKIDVIKKQRSLINNLCTYGGLNLIFQQVEKNFKGMPSDFEREKIKVRKFFIENQASHFHSADLEKIKSLMIAKSSEKIKKYTNLMNMIHSTDYDEKMKNNVDLYEYIMNHPYLKSMDKILLHELSTKYNSIGIERIKTLMKDNSRYKYIEENLESNNNLQDEEYEEDDYNEDEEFYDSGDEFV